MNDIDANEVLREYGFDVPTTGAVYQTVESSHIQDEIIEAEIIEEDASVPTEDIDELIQDFEEVLDEFVSARGPLEEVHIEESIETSAPASSVSVASSEYAIPMIPQSFLKVDEQTTRFSGANWFTKAQEKTLILGGMGGINSWVFMLLTRLKPNQIFIYDDDNVEVLNLAGQFFMNDSVGKKKVNAVAKIAEDFSNYFGTMAISEKFTEATSGGDIMICGFDNMKARRIFYNVWKEHVKNSKDKSKCLFIDGRLAFSDLQVFCITGEDTYHMDIYEKEYLFDDSEAEETICSMKQTTSNAAMIGAIMNNLYINFCALEAGGFNVLPFKTFYDSNLMLFKTED